MKRKKSDEAAVDEWLEAAARAELNLPSEIEEDEQEEDELRLHYAEGESLTFLLRSWQAYRNRGVLPFAGGLADQPRIWFRDSERLSARYAPIFERLLKEKYGEQKRGQSTEGENLNALFYTDESTPDWHSTLRE